MAMSRPAVFVHDDLSLCRECNFYGAGGHALWCASCTYPEFLRGRATWWDKLVCWVIGHDRQQWLANCNACIRCGNDCRCFRHGRGQP